MVGRAATNPERRLDTVPSLPVFERLAPPPAADDLVAEIEAWTTPGDVVLDLTGRGGWVARAAIAEQRRAADFETWPLTRLLAEVVLRPPDLRQIDAAAQAIAAAPLAGSLVRRTIDSMYASKCPRCGRPIVLDAMVWEPFAGPAAAAKQRRGATSAPAAAGSLPTWVITPEESLRAVAREYRCAACHEQFGGPELQVAEATHGDLKLARSISPSGEVRESMRRRFPAPRPTHPLVDQLIDLHTPRQLAGLHAILTRIDGEERAGALTATLRLALLHAVILASRLNASRGRPAAIRISNGAVKVPTTHEWRERHPWLAFEDGLKLVKAFIGKLEAGTPRAAARLGADLAALENGTANVTLIESTPAALRRLGLHGERMAHSGSPSRVRLVLGQAPLRMTPERLAVSYHGTGWLFGAGAVSMLPYDSLFRPTPKASPAAEAFELARSLGRSVAIASPALSHNGRAVILLDDDQPASLVAAAIGVAAAGCRLVNARLHRGDDSSAGIVVCVPPTGVMVPGPRTRANRPLPPVAGGAGDPGTIRGRGIFAPPEKLDDGPFRAGVAAQTVTETTVTLLKARGEPASFEHMLGDLLIGLDRSGQLARLARSLRPPHVDDGWSAWIDDSFVGGFVADGLTVSGDMAGVRGGAGPRGRATDRPTDRTALERTVAAPLEAGATAPGVVDELLELIRAELDRPNNRRIRQIEPGQYWLASEEDPLGRFAAHRGPNRVGRLLASLLGQPSHRAFRHGACDGPVQESGCAGQGPHRSLPEQLYRPHEHARGGRLLGSAGEADGGPRRCGRHARGSGPPARHAGLDREPPADPSSRRPTAV